MPKYSVDILETIEHNYQVEAANWEEANAKARSMFENKICADHEDSVSYDVTNCEEI